jgi:hypothetical protein
MAVHVYWQDAQHTILCAEAAGNWMWDEYYLAIDQMIEMMAGRSDRMDIINIKRPGAQMPRGSAITHFENALQRLPAHCVLVVNVTAHPFARVMATVFNRLHPGQIGKRVHFVASLEDAMSLISQHRKAVISTS